MFESVTEAVLGDVPIRIKVLRTAEAQAMGFMNQPEPADGYGLFFVYSAPRPLSFWMRNVPYDLDLIAFDSSLRVTKVYTLKANEEKSVEIEGGGKYALEMRRGWCAAHGITENSRLIINDINSETSEGIVSQRQVYIHFTDATGAQAIKDSGALWKSSFVDGIFAVAKGGTYVPGVQQTKLGRAKSRDIAVYFTCRDLPDYCMPEECVWKRDSLLIDNIMIKSASDAQRDLDGSLPTINADSWNERLLIPSREMEDPSQPPDYLLKETVFSSKRLKILAGII